ncbi:MAG: formate dehydrogenase subunit gamma [Candidatus Competibacterales bacterium]
MTTRQQNWRRKTMWGAGFLLLMLAVSALLPLTGWLLVDEATAQSAAGDVNQRSEFWRAVRQGNSGYTAVTGQETSVLIQNGGENWRALRQGPVVFFGSAIIIAMLAAIGVFYLIRGTITLEGGRSGLTVERWPLFERVLHWYTAILFLILAVTGLSLLFGRELMIPILGKDAFAAYALAAKNVHNYLGPFFAVGLVVEIVLWMRHNIPSRHDLVWFAKGGGMVGHAHPPAGRMNGGEKVWFWLLVVFGLAMIITGFILNFPQYGQTRDVMQVSHLIHTASALVLIAVALGHIYIATLGTEGALEGMTSGRVDVAWAKQHHDLWLEELEAKGVKPTPVQPKEDVGGAPATPPRPA